MSETHLMVLWLLAAAAVINVLSYGGTTWIHAADQRREDPPEADAPALERVDEVGRLGR